MVVVPPAGDHDAPGPIVALFIKFKLTPEVPAAGQLMITLFPLCTMVIGWEGNAFGPVA